MSNIAEILKTWAEYFHVEGIPQTALRSLGWGIIKGLAALSSALETVATSIYNLLPAILEESGYSELLSDFRPLLITMLGISIVFLGYLFIFKRPESIDGQQIFSNFMMIFLTITVMPLMASHVAELTTSSADEIFNTFEKDGIAVYQVVDNNLLDMRLLLENGKLTSSESQKNAILKDSANCNRFSASKEEMSYIQINEVLDYDNDDYSSEHEDLISQKISVNTNGVLTTVKMNRGFFDIGHEYYYRYHVNWFSLILTLGIVAATYLLAALKLSMIIWEVLLDAIMAPFIAVTDIAAGQRIKEFLKNIMSLLAIICVISLLLGGYGLGLKVLSGLEAGGSLGTGISSKVIYLLLLAGLSWVVIFGPNIIERIFGVDAGLQNSYGVYRVIKDAAGAPGRAAKKAAHAAKAGAKILSGGGEKGSLASSENAKRRTKLQTAGAALNTAGGSSSSAAAVKQDTPKGEKTSDKENIRAGEKAASEIKESVNTPSPRIRSSESASESSRQQSGHSSKESQKVQSEERGVSSGSRIEQRKSASLKTSSEVNGRYSARNNITSDTQGKISGRNISSEQGIRSSSIQRSGAENSANMRSPSTHNSHNSGPIDSKVNRRYSIPEEVKNLRDRSNLNTEALNSHNIQRTQSMRSDPVVTQNRILQNIQLRQQDESKIVVNPDAQNFGRRKPKRK